MSLLDDQIDIINKIKINFIINGGGCRCWLAVHIVGHDWALTNHEGRCWSFDDH